VVKVNIRDCFKYCICFLFICAFQTTNAQYETANWIFSEYTLNFVTENPTITNPILSNYEGAFASYSSDAGKLLISTDGSTVWNGDGAIMKNGENITPYRTNSIIIPKPESENQYYIFSYNAYNVPGNNNHLLSVIVYAIVDLNANNKQGEVIAKNKVLYNNMHGTFTISGKCDRSVFWLVGDVDTNLTEGSDKIFVFQIDKNGISGPFTSKPFVVGPFSTTPLTIGSGADFKLSPDAKKFLFTVSEISGSGTLIADFKPENIPADPIPYAKWIPARGAGEFSSDSRFVYLIAGNSLIQYEIQTEKTTELYYTEDPMGVPQMAANGKIYIPVSGEKKLMVINKPNQAGSSCEFSASGISIPAESYVLPVFASNLFRSGPFPAMAGSDKIICKDESVTIGSLANQATTFSWSPAVYLDDPGKLQPTFQYTGLGEDEEFTYKFTTYFDGCSQSDLVNVKLNPRPQPPAIYGSKSVCPGVNGVQYWTDKNDDFSYSWNIDGGTIEGVGDQDALLVNWGLTTPLALVGLYVTDGYGCKSDVTWLDVLIDDKLQPEKPKGLDSVCVNLANQNAYQITKTTGSNYEWGLLGGEIIGNSTTNKVIVDWKDNRAGKIWVREQNVTNEAACFGISDTLNVTVFKDPAAINLDFVTVDEFDEKIIHLQASATQPGRMKDISIFSRKEGSGVWEEIANVQPASLIQFSKGDFLSDDYMYQFQVNILNKCDERSVSNIHNSIRLSAQANEELNSIELLWNSYNFWTMGEVTYEVLTALSEPKVFEPVTAVQMDTSASIRADESFQYFIRIKSMRYDGVYTSLSNEVKLTINHEVMIPNVITPNDDGFNDTFEIKNIKLYPQNRLLIVNRYGKTIFDQSGYTGGWNGGEGDSGVYYFTLLLPEKQLEYKGWLHVIK